MEFDNLKSLVEYMYKGEANVPQQMLPAFIKDAESLQIRGLAECATKHQFDLDNLASSPATSSPISHSRQQPPLSSSTPILSTGHPGHMTTERERSVGKSKNGSNHDRSNSAAAKNSVLGPGGILAARLKDMTAQAGGPPMGPLFDFMSNTTPESFHNMVARNPGLFAGAGIPGVTPPSGVLPPMPSVTKKSRKSAEPRPRGGSPAKDPSKKLKLKSPNVPLPPVVSTNNNYGDLDDDGDGNLKIDEDADPGKENLENKMDTADQDSIVAVGDMDNSNGVSEEEEEPSMPGPGGNFVESASTYGLSQHLFPSFLLVFLRKHIWSGHLPLQVSRVSLMARHVAGAARRLAYCASKSAHYVRIRIFCSKCPFFLCDRCKHQENLSNIEFPHNVVIHLSMIFTTGLMRTLWVSDMTLSNAPFLKPLLSKNLNMNLLL